MGSDASGSRFVVARRPAAGVYPVLLVLLALGAAGPALPEAVPAATSVAATGEDFSVVFAADDALLDKARGWVADLPAPDTTTWSEKRIADYAREMASTDGHRLPEAMLRIPAIDIAIPVFEGTEERYLTLGAGRIEGTPALASGGNTGLAAHRDGYFRALKDVRINDSIFVETLTGQHEYRITDLFIVDPHAVHVLEPTGADAITIVTCYPFYFVGNAPERYIVRAERRD